MIASFVKIRSIPQRKCAGHRLANNLSNSNRILLQNYCLPDPVLAARHSCSRWQLVRGQVDDQPAAASHTARNCP